MFSKAASDPHGLNDTPRRIGRRDLFTFRGASTETADYWVRVHRPAMACRFEIALSGEDARHVAAARAALDEVDRIECALTVFRETSALVHVNRHAADGPVEVDADLFDLLAMCRDLHAFTGGAFDITSTPLSRCWGFLRREGRLPEEAEIEAARSVVGMEHVALDAETRTVRFLRPGVELNLGAIGKGYALDRVVHLLRARGVEHALVSAAGSSVRALGGRAGDWTIDVASRQVSQGPLGRLRLRDGALGTSGAGVQYVEVDGKRYGHVIDPRSGRPTTGVLSVTVVTDSAAAADALSTAFFVGGAELAERCCAARPGTLALVTPDDASPRPRTFGAYANATLAELWTYKETAQCI